MYKCVCTGVYTPVCSYFCVYTCGVQRKKLGVFFYCSPLIPLRQGFSLILKLTISPMLAPRIPLSASQC